MANGATLEKLQEEALTLSRRERADLARALIASLDGVPDSDVTEAWEKEVLRRMGEVEADNTRLLDRAEFRSRLAESLKRS